MRLTVDNRSNYHIELMNNNHVYCVRHQQVTTWENFQEGTYDVYCERETNARSQITIQVPDGRKLVFIAFQSRTGGSSLGFGLAQKKDTSYVHGDTPQFAVNFISPLP
mmetsp:Transcript_1148/g.3934  ORF Transcript_1148/g.3934 Transcript_1148/m.3934 type:complete len:108 (-) Transcript_1148:155-478(-)